MGPLRIRDFEAVVFDLFHTLSTLVHTGAPGRSTPEILGLDSGAWNDALFHRSGPRLRGEITEPTAMLRSVVEEIGVVLPDEVIRDAAAHRYGRFRHSLLNPLPHVLATLAALRDAGRRIGLVSNADAGERAAWEEGPMAAFFDAAVFSCDVGMVKPEPGIFLRALDLLGVSPARTLYVGDGGNGELQAAKELGMTTAYASEFVEDLWPDEAVRRRDWGDYRICRLDQLAWNLD